MSSQRLLDKAVVIMSSAEEDNATLHHQLAEQTWAASRGVRQSGCQNRSASSRIFLCLFSYSLSLLTELQRSKLRQQHEKPTREGRRDYIFGRWENAALQQQPVEQTRLNGDLKAKNTVWQRIRCCESRIPLSIV